MEQTTCKNLLCGELMDADEANWDSGYPQHEECANPSGRKTSHLGDDFDAGKKFGNMRSHPGMSGFPARRED